MHHTGHLCRYIHCTYSSTEPTEAAPTTNHKILLLPIGRKLHHSSWYSSSNPVSISFNPIFHLQIDHFSAAPVHMPLVPVPLPIASVKATAVPASMQVSPVLMQLAPALMPIIPVPMQATPVPKPFAPVFKPLALVLKPIAQVPLQAAFSLPAALVLMVLAPVHFPAALVLTFAPVCMPADCYGAAALPVCGVSRG